MQSSQPTYVDRRSPEEQQAGLATQILFWYDFDRKNRRRINGVAITTEGHIAVATATCSLHDNFNKARGRMIVSKRLMGRAANYACVLIPRVETYHLDDFPQIASDTYLEEFPDNDKGSRRVYNAARIYTAYKTDLIRQANEILDNF